jgi:hypothetical protein
MDDDLSMLVNSVYDADAPQRFAAFSGNINGHAIMRGHWGVAMTPLMAAVQSCRADVLEALRLRGDVQPNLVEGCMFSALSMAVQNAIHQSALPSMHALGVCVSWCGRERARRGVVHNDSAGPLRERQ